MLYINNPCIQVDQYMRVHYTFLLVFSKTKMFKKKTKENKKTLPYWNVTFGNRAIYEKQNLNSQILFSFSLHNPYQIKF